MTTFTRQVFGGIAAASLIATVPALPAGPAQEASDEPPSTEENLAALDAGALLPVSVPALPDRVVQRVPVVVTAYSSTPGQTDDTPFITASGTTVRDGIVAANFLPLGTRVKLPELYGDKVFVVEDRMHPRKQYVVDIWFPSYWEAKSFGAHTATVEVLN